MAAGQVTRLAQGVTAGDCHGPGDVQSVGALILTSYAI